MKIKKLVVLAITCSISVMLISLSIATAETNGTASNEERDSLSMLQNSFRSVAKRVYPSVVSITSVQVERKKGGIYYVPYRDPLFDDFFGNPSNPFSPHRRGVGVAVPEKEIKRIGIGSGVIIDPRGYILTNYHVVEKAMDNKVSVVLADGRETQGDIKGSDPRFDIALIKVNDDNLSTAEMGDSSKLAVGDWAIAIGNPYGFAFDDAQPTMTVGVISALNRSLPGWIGLDRSYHNLIQTDAAINMGNSGGPLVNLKGEVVGINVAIVSTTGGNQGLGFAIPSNLCQDIIAEVIQGKEVLYSWLGVSVQNLTPELSEYFKFPLKEGVLVIKSLPDGPARIAGIRDGDIVTYFNNKKIEKVEELLAAVNMSRAGERVKMTVYRDEMEYEIDVIMGSRPREVARGVTFDTLYWRGLKVDNITYEMARDLGLAHLRGVVVTEVEEGSAADKASITPGEIIVEINDVPIATLDDYYASIFDLTGDVLIKTMRGYFVIKE